MHKLLLIYLLLVFVYDSIQATKHVSRPNLVKNEVLLYDVSYIISYAEFSAIVNGKSSSGLPIFSIFSPDM